MPEKIHEFIEFGQMVQEATQSVEQELNIEDKGWTLLGQAARDVVSPYERVANVRASRLYYVKDPLAKQAIRLWTDYTFGSGMTYSVPEDAKKTQEVLDAYWNNTQNLSILSARGQRKSSDKLLVDGEIFFVQFLGPNGQATVRWIDPLEITEIITDPEDIENVLYYRRQWMDRQGTAHNTIYRSASNIKNVSTIDATRRGVSATDDGIVSHLTYNTITQRGNPLLLPALDWIKQYRRFLAARVAIMLALTRFAWQMKVMGGQTAVDAQKAKLEVDDDPVEAGAVASMNAGVDLKPIKTDSGAKNAYDDGRMLKLQVASGTGLPEQYFGDIGTGNWATAKTVELPVLKMFESLQQVWDDFYQGMDEIVLDNAEIPPDKWYVDRDFPPIAPKDVEVMANAIEKIVGVFPQLADSPQVQQQALLSLRIDDPEEVLANLEKEIAKNPDAAFAKALREFRTTLKGDGNGSKVVSDIGSG